jgi:hypothetical protein
MEQPHTHRPAGVERLNVRHRRKKSSTAVTNGAAERASYRAWAKRHRDLLQAHINDLGGLDAMSASELVLADNGATIEVELERRSLQMARAGQADDVSFSIFLTGVNTLRRTLEALGPGLQRRTRDVTPTLAEYLQQKAETDNDSAEAAE